MDYWSKARIMYRNIPENVRTQTSVYVGGTIYLFKTIDQAFGFFMQKNEEKGSDEIGLFRPLYEMGEFTWMTKNKSFVIVYGRFT